MPYHKRYGKKKYMRRNTRNNKAALYKGPVPNRKKYPKRLYNTLALSANSLFPQGGRKVIMTYGNSQIFTVPSTATGGVISEDIELNDLSLTKPRWFDTIFGANNSTQPYNSYIVHSGKININIRHIESSVRNLYVSLSVYRDGKSIPSTLDECYERSDTKVRMLQPLGAGSRNCSISMPFSVKRLWNVTNLNDSDEFRSVYTTRPAGS